MQRRQEVVSILTTIERLASHVAVDVPTATPALSSKRLSVKAALQFQNHFKSWSD